MNSLVIFLNHISLIGEYLKILPEQMIELLQIPELVHVVNAVLLFKFRGSMAYPELQVTSTVV